MSIDSQKKVIKNPYPGIRSFNVDESKLFFGREKQIDELSEIIKRNHFAAISGASGSGKSSIVKAGIIPFFKNLYEDLEYIIFRPGNNPLKNFVDKFADLSVSKGFDRKTVKKELSELHKNPSAFVNILSSININNKFLIYIDQFEEIFRYKDNEAIKNAEENSQIFIQNIINATKSSTVDVFVVLSLRSDFLSDCTIFPGLPEMINKGHYLLPNLTFEQKEDAIRKPAEFAGAFFSDELIEQIRNDIRNENINLPVLQHALMRTWDYWLYNSMFDSKIDIEHYEAIGTVNNALSVHAENIFNSLNDEQKVLTEKIFRALTFGGNEERSVRSPQVLSRLMKITSAREMEIIEIVDLFRAEGSSFLMPSSHIQLKHDTVIDISHESIMHVWNRLSQWCEYETNSAQIYIRLSHSANLYQEGKTGLLINPDLQIALNWMETDKPNKEWARRYDPAFERVVNYIFYSKKEYNKVVAAKAEKNVRSLKRARYIAFFLGSAALISILFLIVALNLRFKALQSEKEALSKQEIAMKQSKIAELRRRDAVASQLVAKQQQEIAEQNRQIAEKQKQYAVAQQKEALFQKQQALFAKNDAFIARDLAKKLQIEAEILRDKAIEQKIIADNEKLRAEFSEAKTDSLRKLAVAKNMAIKSIKIFEDNLKRQNLSNEDKNLPNILLLQAYYFNKQFGGNIYDPDLFSAFLIIGENQEKLLDIHSDATRKIVFNSNTNSFFSASDDGHIFEIEFDNLKNVSELHSVEKNNFRAIDVNKSGKYIVAGTKTGEIFLWSEENKTQKPFSSNIHKSTITDIVFVSDNEFVSTSYDGKIILWKITANSFSKLSLYSTIRKNVSVAFSDKLSQVVVASENGVIEIFKSTDLSSVKKLETTYGKISCISCFENGDLFVGYTNGLVVDLASENYTEKEKWFAHNSAITEILFSKINNLIITSSFDRTIKIWNAKNITDEPISITDHDSWVYSVCFSGDEKKIISGDANGKIIITTIDINSLKQSVKGNLIENMSKKNWLLYVGEGIEYQKKLPDDL